MELVQLFKLLFQLHKLILVVEKKPVAKPGELAIDRESRIASFDSREFAIALRVRVY